MKAPEKLYVDVRDNLSDSFLYGFTEKRTDEDIEYIRTYAFIEKAVQFIKEHFQFEDPSWYKDGEPTVKDEAIEDFRNYMKGE